MRLGIFGGTFDPPHLGHLLTAVDAYEELELDRLIFVPAAVQPLKAGQAAAPPEDRLEMTRLLVAGDARFAVDAIEIDRTGLSYTVETLEAFARHYPHAERFFLVGADAIASFAAWREPERIVRLARLAVLQRPGSTVEPGPAGLPRDAIILPTRLVDISSTEIRERVRAGRPIRGFVTDSVAEFIAAKQLYR